jgi:hypothetical protein
MRIADVCSPIVTAKTTKTQKRVSTVSTAALYTEKAHE